MKVSATRLLHQVWLPIWNRPKFIRHIYKPHFEFKFRRSNHHSWHFKIIGIFLRWRFAKKVRRRKIVYKQKIVPRFVSFLGQKQKHQFARIGMTRYFSIRYFLRITYTSRHLRCKMRNNFIQYFWNYEDYVEVDHDCTSTTSEIRPTRMKTIKNIMTPVHQNETVIQKIAIEECE